MEFVNAAIKSGKYTGPKSGKAFTIDKDLYKRSQKQAKMLETVPKADLGRSTKDKGGKSGSGTTSAAVIVVEGFDTLQCVEWLAVEHGVVNPAVLIFASDSNPGGSKKGANLGTQEEAVCRCSTLRPVQEQLKYPIPHLGLAYVPHVQALLDNGPREFGAICAALRLAVSGDVPTGKEMEFLVTKCASILDAAVLGGHKSIVLGAWGCGAFSNPPEVVAAVFGETIRNGGYDRCFEHIVFAIPNKELRSAFSKVLTS